MRFGRDPDLCYWIIILSLAMTMKQIERFQVSVPGFRFIGVNDTEFLNRLILALFVLILQELYVCVSASCCVTYIDVSSSWCPPGAALNAKDFGRNFTAREWAIFTGRYETAWLMTRLMERPCPRQYCDTFR